MKIELRDYQSEVINRARQAFRRSRRVLIQAPTGSGKTVLAAYMIAQTVARGDSAWFACHRAELVDGTSKTLRKFDQPHGIIGAGYPLDTSQSVQVCSIDTLKNRLHILRAPKLAIIDEAHHCSAAGWAKVTDWLHDNGACIIGLSATPRRLDGKGLDAHFDDLVIGPDVLWLIEQGHLSPYRIFAPPGPDMSGVKKRMGDYATSETAERVDRPTLIGDIVTHWDKHARGMRTVAFGVTVAHSQHIADSFSASGIAAAHLDGNTDRETRARTIVEFSSGKIDVICNVNLFGEGFDLSSIAQRDVAIDCVIQARPTQSLALHLQQVGRAMRPREGKTAMILDHAGNTLRHGLPDDDREWSLEGRDMKKRRAEENEIPPPTICEGCFHAVKKPLPPACPYCGKPFRMIEQIETTAGDLIEITQAQIAEARRSRIREDRAAKTVDDLYALGRARGYKYPMHWAQKLYAARQRS